MPERAARARRDETWRFSINPSRVRKAGGWAAPHPTFDGAFSIGLLPPQRPHVEHHRVDVPRVERVPPRWHEAGQADAGAAAADGVGELGVRLALLKGRI